MKDFITCANVQKLDDQKLFELCQDFGRRALLWRQRFMGLLPEVNRRRLYEKKGFSSIFEFAAKLAGMSNEQVRLVLNLEKKFEDKPVLQKMLIEGEVSVNKLARITAIATVENQEFLADQVQLLSNRALEVLVKDIKFENSETKNQDGLFEPENSDKSLHVQTEKRILQLLDETGKPAELKLSIENFQKLLALQNKGIDINEFIEESLQKREEEIETEKEKLAEEDLQKQEKRKAEGKKVTRYITADARRLLQKEHGTKCEVTSCDKPAVEINHRERFSNSQNNDLRKLNQLCAEHHKIFHSIDVKFNEIRLKAIKTWPKHTDSIDSRQGKTTDGIGQIALQTQE